MSTISEEKFARICRELYRDRDQIQKFNPYASQRETILWVLLGVLISFLSIPDSDLPANTGMSAVELYSNAILELLEGRMDSPFNPQPYLDELLGNVGTESV